MVLRGGVVRSGSPQRSGQRVRSGQLVSQLHRGSRLSRVACKTDFLIFYLHFIIPGHLTWVRLWQPQEQLYPVHAWSFLCFLNPPKSDMDCRVFNVCLHDHSYACVIHTGVRHTDSESAQHFFNYFSPVFLVLLIAFKLGSWNS